MSAFGSKVKASQVFPSLSDMEKAQSAQKEKSLNVDLFRKINQNIVGGEKWDPVIEDD